MTLTHAGSRYTPDTPNHSEKEMYWLVARADLLGTNKELQHLWQLDEAVPLGQLDRLGNLLVLLLVPGGAVATVSSAARTGVDDAAHPLRVTMLGVQHHNQTVQWI